MLDGGVLGERIVPDSGVACAAMAHDRRFRFGIQLSTAASGADWAELARKAEDLGYDTLFMPDHFGDQLAPVPALMAAADATTELKVGALVFDNDYKHPVVLAKELATIDVLSGGRLEVGIGAGWMQSDYDQSGIPMDPPGRARVPHGRGHRGHQGVLRRRPLLLRRRALHDHRVRRPAQAGAVAAAVPHRRRRQAGALDRGSGGADRRDQPLDPQRPSRRRRGPERGRRRDRPEARSG